jgi:hypothetical protein
MSIGPQAVFSAGNWAVIASALGPVLYGSNHPCARNAGMLIAGRFPPVNLLGFELVLSLHPRQ